MRSPFSAPQFLFLFAILVLTGVILYFGVVTVAFDKLGLSPASALLLLGCTLFGSAINLPLFTIDAETTPPGQRNALHGMPFGEPTRFPAKTVVAINLGGALIPLSFSLYLLASHRLPFVPVATAIAIVSAICYVSSRPIPGLGVGIPIFIAPFSAALTALALWPQQGPPLAYVCGTLGVLIGADLLRLRDVRKIGAPVASIGGAGSFDGIFLTGIVAVLLT